MKNRLLLSLLVLILLSFPTRLLGEGSPFLPFDSETPNMRLLLSFPRSGTNLLSSSLQALLHNYIHRVGQNTPFVLCNNRLALDLDPNIPPLYRSHFPEKIECLNKNNNKLILILRNYREALHRQISSNTPVSEEIFVETFTSNAPILQKYARILEVFSDWPREKRLLIYYEDLIQDLARELVKVLSFLEEDIPPTCNNGFLQEVQEQILLSYHVQHKESGGSHSQGKDPLFHSKQLSQESILLIDQAVFSLYPILAGEFLSRYRGMHTID